MSQCAQRASFKNFRVPAAKICRGRPGACVLAVAVSLREPLLDATHFLLLGYSSLLARCLRLVSYATGALPSLRLCPFHAGDRAQLEGIRFVITLDADTQLLRDTARRMIETLAHPLNQARLSPDGRHVVRGYTIIQPSVSASLPSATATWKSCERY